MISLLIRSIMRSTIGYTASFPYRYMMQYICSGVILHSFAISLSVSFLLSLPSRQVYAAFDINFRSVISIFLQYRFIGLHFRLFLRGLSYPTNPACMLQTSLPKAVSWPVKIISDFCLSAFATPFGVKHNAIK